MPEKTARPATAAEEKGVAATVEAEAEVKAEKAQAKEAAEILSELEAFDPYETEGTAEWEDRQKFLASQEHKPE